MSTVFDQWTLTIRFELEKEQKEKRFENTARAQAKLSTKAYLVQRS